MNKTLEKIKKRGIIISINKKKTIARTRQIIKYPKRESNKRWEFESKNYLAKIAISYLEYKNTINNLCYHLS